MVQINFARREVNCKIVYYGPGLSGKTTNLEIVHQKAPTGSKGKMTSIATEGDRTLFFDFLPLDLGEVAGMRTKFQLYTVPGQVYYNSTRKLVLQGADGVVFVADSNPAKMVENMESLNNLVENMIAHGMDPFETPFVLQYNKRDLPGALSVDDLNTKMNKWKLPTYEAVAVKGEGVLATLKGISKLVLERLNRDYVKSATASTAPQIKGGTPSMGTPVPGAAAPMAPRPPQPQPAARPPQPVARPPQPQPAARPPQPAARPPQPAARPAQPQFAPQQRPPAPPPVYVPPPPVPAKSEGCFGLILVVATTALAAAASLAIAFLSGVK